MFSLSINRVISVLLLSIFVSGFSVSSFSATEKVTKPTAAKVAKAKAVIEQTVNINTATAEMISSHLKGIGLKKAQAIIEWRKVNGKFISAEQLTEVKGIGEKTVLANKKKIAL
jgi:competence protein ComEA